MLFIEVFALRDLPFYFDSLNNCECLTGLWSYEINREL